MAISSFFAGCFRLSYAPAGRQVHTAVRQKKEDAHQAVRVFFFW
jgi:hypothetical protein